MLDESCSECNRLWSEHASATAEYLNRMDQMIMASYDSGLYEIAERTAKSAKKHQEVARMKMEHHEAFHDRSFEKTRLNALQASR